MKNAIIDPREQVNKIVGWTSATPPMPILEQIANSARVAEVAAQMFPVAEPLFWVECVDEVVADQWYYDTIIKAILIVPPMPPKPAAEDQPVVFGAQSA